MSRFSAPIAEYIWDLKYRMKEEDGTPIDQTVEESWARVAGALAIPEADKHRWEMTFYKALEDFQFLPAGRVLAGAGTGRAVTLFNCYVMGTVPDSMHGIFHILGQAALTMQQGGGIGTDFSTLRPKGALVKGVAADASGPLTFMDCWDSMCRTVMSAGSRRGAMMATMRCDHPDIEAFIDAKQDPLRFRMFNLSVLVTDAFMAAVKADIPWNLTFNGAIYKTIKAVDLWDKIMRSTYAQAEPGVIFIDRINAANNLHYCETISSTNPCAEQPLPPYGACLLGSVNLTRVICHAFGAEPRVDTESLKDLIRTAVRMLDNVVDVSNFPLPEQEAEAKNKRRLGIGLTGLGDALAMMKITYGSEAAQFWTSAICEIIAVTAYDESVNLAIEKGAFPAFSADDYLRAGTFASTLPRWLQDRIHKYGIRNSHLTSIAPTGTISLYAGNVSSGIEPIFALTYDRKILQPDGSKITEKVEDYAVAEYRKFWEADNPMGDFDLTALPEYFVTAQTLTPHDHVVMQAAAQRWVDSSISKTTNCPAEITFEDFKAIYQMAYDMGCKGCTTYRPNEITGSIISVSEEPKPVEEGMPWDEATQSYHFPEPKPFEKEMDRDAFIDAVRGVLEKAMDRHTAKEFLRDLMETYGLDRASNTPPKERKRFLELLTQGVPVVTSTKVVLDAFRKVYPEAKETFESAQPTSGLAALAKREAASYASTPAPEDDAPITRPDHLDGTVYKLKFPGAEHALYITIADVETPEGMRPFEIFFNSKGMEHFAWTVALSRTISAIFRRPHDSTFIVEELKSVYDPKGGGYIKGKYVPSIIAAIGGVIEQHMIRIGYIKGVAPAERPLKVNPIMVSPYTGGDRDSESLFFRVMGGEEAGRATSVMPETKDQVYDPKAPLMHRPDLCPKCFSPNYTKIGGCFTCGDCGNSACG